MLRIGLTGGIASGKSTVTAMLRERGLPVLDADDLTHQLLEPGQASYDEIAREFGREILGGSGKIDRAKLGAIVFSDSTKRARLNQIIHPRIRTITTEWFASQDRPGGPPLAFEDAALIIEGGIAQSFDRVVVCWCRPEQQLERLVARGLSREDAERRIAAQMPIDEKRRLADDVIDCSGTLDETRRQIPDLLAKWQRLTPRNQHTT
jgi:dephospho-CoA kinase